MPDLLRRPAYALRPGDEQPAQRALHIGYADADAPPERYLCGAPVRVLVARAGPGQRPLGGGVCPVCLLIDAARSLG